MRRHLIEAGTFLLGFLTALWISGPDPPRITHAQESVADDSGNTLKSDIARMMFVS